MGREYPHSPVVGVGSLVMENGMVLLVKRKNDPGRNLWSVPGGHLELGEDVLEAAVRELEEETGVRAEPLGIINVDTLVVRDRQSKIKYHYVLIDVLMANARGEPRASGDVLEVRYFNLSDAMKLSLTSTVRGLLEKIWRGEIDIKRPIPHYKHEIGEV